METVCYSSNLVVYITVHTFKRDQLPFKLDPNYAGQFTLQAEFTVKGNPGHDTRTRTR